MFLKCYHMILTDFHPDVKAHANTLRDELKCPE